MSSGAYVALSGMHARMEQLNRLASDLANAATSGYKAERSTTAAAERPGERFSQTLQSAIDVADGPRSLDFRPGTIASTGRELDLAIEGKGFFVIESPDGLRYTRNGHFTRRGDGVLATEEGFAVMGEDGPLRLPTEGGDIRIVDGGLIVAGDTPIGRPQVVDFSSYDGLGREDGARFRQGQAGAPAPVTGARLVAGALEASNVSVVERMAQLTEVSRGFEALQRGVSILMNDLDGRAITELGRR